MGIDVHCSVLKIISYFHFFKYPVTKQEIWQYLPVLCNKEGLDAAIADLLRTEIIFNFGCFYSLSNDYRLIERRLTGNAYAQKQLAKANRIANFLGKFPFVEAVCISGSLSKDFSAPNGDLDYFIITAPNRLWIARTIMHFFKKFTFLANAQHSFCMNYYLGMEQLNVEPKNFYTAIELATLKPAYAHSGLQELFDANGYWISGFLPNEDSAGIHRNFSSKNRITAALETIINRFGGDRINRALYNFSRWKWILKWKRKNYDAEKCLECMGLHFNTPVNYPKNLMQIILEGSENIYRKAEKAAVEKLKARENATMMIKQN